MGAYGFTYYYYIIYFKKQHRVGQSTIPRFYGFEMLLVDSGSWLPERKSSSVFAKCWREIEQSRKGDDGCQNGWHMDDSFFHHQTLYDRKTAKMQ